MLKLGQCTKYSTQIQPTTVDAVQRLCLAGLLTAERTKYCSVFITHWLPVARKQVCVQLPTYADNLALPAVLLCAVYQSNDISCLSGPQQQTCSREFAAVAHAGIDRQMPDRCTDPASHGTWAVPSIPSPESDIIILWPNIPVFTKNTNIKILFWNHTNTQTHTHTFNGPFSGTTWVSRYQKGKPIWILLKQETVSGSGNSWAICKSASRSRQITTPVPHHSSFFYRPDALPAAQPTVSKHWRQIWSQVSFETKLTWQKIQTESPLSKKNEELVQM